MNAYSAVGLGNPGVEPRNGLPSGSASLVVTVDGGAAAGKSSTSKRVAEICNLLHVDTGSHYRAITWALLTSGFLPPSADGPAEPDSTPSADSVAAVLGALDLGWTVVGRSAVVVLGGGVVAETAIRSGEVNARVSQVASWPQVRAYLRDYQRRFAQIATDEGFGGLIMEGRDIGSVIFPDAPLRFFLEADVELRQQRRAADGQADLIGERDRRDSSRATAPLVRPDGASLIDTGSQSLEAVVAYICESIRAWSGR